MGAADYLASRTAGLTEREQREPVPDLLVAGEDGAVFRTPMTEEASADLTTGKLRLARGTVRMIGPKGNVLEVGADAVEEFVGRGYVVAPPNLERRVRQEDRLTEYYSGRPGAALVQGIGRGLTVGGSDALAGAFGYGEAVDYIARENSGFATAGEILGALGGSFIPGLNAIAPVGRLGRAGARVAGLGKGAGALGRVGGLAAGAALEGGVYSAGVTAGAAIRRGDDADAVVSQALDAGVMGGATGAAFGMLGGLGGEAWRKFRAPAIKAKAADEVVGALHTELGQLKADIAPLKPLARKAGAADARVAALERQVDELRKLGATDEAISAAESEVVALREAVKVDSGLAKRIAKEAEDARRELLGKWDAARAQQGEHASDILIATRGAGERLHAHVRLVDDLMGLGPGVAGDPFSKTRTAYKSFRKAEGSFDDAFLPQIEKTKAGTSITMQGKILQTLEADPALVQKLARNYEQAGLDLAAAMVDDGILAPVQPGMATQPGQRRLVEITDDAADQLGTLSASGADMPEAIAKRLAELEGQAAGAAAKPGLTKQNLLLKQKEAKQLAQTQNRLAAHEGELARARERATEARGRLGKMEALKSEQGELRSLVDELSKDAESFGFKITPADVAAAAMELGLDGTEWEWVARAHLLSRFAGGRGIGGLPGISGIGNRIASSAMAGAGREMARGAVRKVLPSARGGLLGSLLSGGASGAGSAAGRSLAKGTLGAGGKVAPRVTARQARQLFESRVERAMARNWRLSRGVGRAGVAAGAVLSRVKFADIRHPQERDLDPTSRAFERRARELEYVLGNTDASLMIQGRLVDRGLTDEETAAITAETMVRAYEFLHGKLPPRRGATITSDRWNASDSEMATFARYVRYFSDPALVAEDFSSGALTPEGPEFLREVQPGMYTFIQAKLLERTVEMGDTTPYDQRVMTRIYFDIPVDRAASPEFGAAVAGYAAQAAGVQPTPSAPPGPSGPLRLSSNASSKAQRLEAR